jgi:hypothetical protein
MDFINRQVAVIKPKGPYIHWINSLTGTVDPVSIDELQNDCTVILLPHFDTDRESLVLGPDGAIYAAIDAGEICQQEKAGQ